MVDLVELNKRVFEELDSFSVEGILPDLKDVAPGSLKDVLDTSGSYYYQWLACLMRVLKPKQIVELGGAMGTSALCMLSQLPEDAKLYSITLEEGGLEFSYIKSNYPQLVKVIGNDLDLDVWPDDLDWYKTDLLFIDAEHTYNHVKKELDLYIPRLKPGTLVLMDDIKMEELYPLWVSIVYPKLDLGTLHHSGFGMFVVEKNDLYIEDATSAPEEVRKTAKKNLEK